jgi:ABC-type Fe3+/spermidine/putrescine transport system ATPase subunit
LLDEPLSNLDAHLRLEMRELILGVQKALGVTMIFVTHDQEEAVMLADDVALILNGRLCQYDKAEAFYQRPASEAVARFFGGRNFLPGVADGQQFQAAIGRLVLPAGMPQGVGMLTIRPEAIRVGGTAVNMVEVQVVARIYLGTQTRLTLRAGETLLDAVVGQDVAEGIVAGQMITINLPPQSLWVLPASGPRP